MQVFQLAARKKFNEMLLQFQYDKSIRLKSFDIVSNELHIYNQEINTIEA